MSKASPSKERTGSRAATLALFVPFAFIVLSCGGCWMLFGRSELLTTFTVASYTINIYAEPEFFYEPPGYIYFELKQWGHTRIPERRFMGIGPERKPAQNFTLVKADDDEIVAILLGGDVQMIHEFSSGFTWPGPYTNVTESQWETAELMLERLRVANPGIRCSRQHQYRRELDYRMERDRRQAK